MRILIFILFSIVILGCETTIEPKLNDAERILVIDAWINQKPERQEIRIMRSQPYFEQAYPEKIRGAIVSVRDLDNGDEYVFEEEDGVYYWQPNGNGFGIVGHHYRLVVEVDGETFEAFSRLGRVPPIDTIEFFFKKKDFLIEQDYFLAEFKALEPKGVGDTYWIKSWKNGSYLNKPGELNMVYDASFTAGLALDGEQFAIPIRRDFLNPMDLDPDNKNKFLPPYLVNDSASVEIHSIDPAAFDFLFGVYFHTTRPGGLAELFATPLGNALTNLRSTRAHSSTNIAGFFNVAAVSVKGQRLTPEIAELAKQNSQ
jgi:hypothetical protein